MCADSMGKKQECEYTCLRVYGPTKDEIVWKRLETTVMDGTKRSH